MNHTLSWLASVDWLEVIRSLAPVATAAIAFAALKSWRTQEKAKTQGEFLDNLIEATHTYVVHMQTVIAVFHSAKIGMMSQVRDWEESEEEDKVAGAIAYIERRGTQDGQRLAAALAAAEPAVIKLRSLAAKGQVFKFRNFAKCQDAVTQLSWHFDRLLSFTSMIGSPTWNWENPEVRSLLKKVMIIEPDDIHASIGENDIAVLEFARESYKRIYG
jgi:hypothetical protein